MKLSLSTGTPDKEKDKKIYDQNSKLLIGTAALEPSQLQDLAEIVPDLLDIKAKTGVPITIHIRIEAGDGKDRPTQKTADQVNAALAKFKKDFKIG